MVAFMRHWLNRSRIQKSKQRIKGTTMEATAAGSKPLLAANNIVSNGGVSRRVSGKNTKPDQKDFENMQVTVEFKLEAPDAKAVCVAGTFNNWEPKGTPLKQNGAR